MFEIDLISFWYCARLFYWYCSSHLVRQSVWIQFRFVCYFFFKNNFFFHTDSLPHIVSTPQLTIAISLSLSLFYIFFKKEEQLSFFVR